MDDDVVDLSLAVLIRRPLGSEHQETRGRDWKLRPAHDVSRQRTARHHIVVHVAFAAHDVALWTDCLPVGFKTTRQEDIAAYGERDNIDWAVAIRCEEKSVVVTADNAVGRGLPLSVRMLPGPAWGSTEPSMPVSLPEPCVV